MVGRSQKEEKNWAQDRSLRHTRFNTLKRHLSLLYKKKKKKTHCFLSVKYDFIQLREFDENLYIDRFFNRSSWSTTSKAFHKSKKMAQTSSPLSILFNHLSRRFMLCCMNGVFGRLTVNCVIDHID